MTLPIKSLTLGSFALATSMLLSVNVQAQNKNIYHKGWIDLNKNGKKDIYEDSTQPIDKRVENLLSLMTLEEKNQPNCNFVWLW